MYKSLATSEWGYILLAVQTWREHEKSMEKTAVYTVVYSVESVDE